MKTSVGKATAWFVIVWVLVEAAFYYVNSRTGFTGNYIRPLAGLMWGLLVGIFLMKFAGLKFFPMLLIGGGFAAGNYFAPQAFEYFTSGVRTFGPLISSQTPGQIETVIVSNSSLINTLIGFFTGALGGLITALLLRPNGKLADTKIMVVTAGWAFAFAIGFLLDNLLIGNLLRPYIIQGNSLLFIQASIVLSGAMVSAIGGGVMFRAIKESRQI